LRCSFSDLYLIALTISLKKCFRGKLLIINFLTSIEIVSNSRIRFLNLHFQIDDMLWYISSKKVLLGISVFWRIRTTFVKSVTVLERFSKRYRFFNKHVSRSIIGLVFRRFNKAAKLATGDLKLWNDIRKIF
jgi:hypothetical protein